MAKAVVTIDTYRWHEEYGNPNSQILEADRGETIDVSEKELERGLKMDPAGLAKPGSKDAKSATEEPPPGE